MNYRIFAIFPSAKNLVIQGKKKPQKLWTNLRGSLDRFTVVIDTYRKLGYSHGNYEDYIQIPEGTFCEYYPRADYQVEFYDEFPDELMARPELKIYVKPKKELEWDLDVFDEWVGRKPKLVYGWKRALTAEYI
jgi:hypothetical protein